MIYAVTLHGIIVKEFCMQETGMNIDSGHVTNQLMPRHRLTGRSNARETLDNSTNVSRRLLAHENDMQGIRYE